MNVVQILTKARKRKKKKKKKKKEKNNRLSVDKWLWF